MNLIRMIYASAISETCSIQEIQKILESARRRNVPDEITGFLCFARGFFLQILEGDHKVVSETFCRIAQDPRHANAALLDCSPIAARQFSDWSMGYVGETKANRALFVQYSETDRFDPYKLTRDNAASLLVALSDQQKASQRQAAA